MTIGEKIKQSRMQKGYSLADLALLMDVNRATISKWESGKIKEINRSNLKKLAQILDIDLPDFFANVNSEPDDEAEILIHVATDARLRDMIAQYESLSPQKQAQVREYIQLLAGK